MTVKTPLDYLGHAPVCGTAAGNAPPPRSIYRIRCGDDTFAMFAVIGSYNKREYRKFPYLPSGFNWQVLRKT